MDVGTATILGLVGLMSLNQAVMRQERLARTPLIFWGVQFLDLALASAVLFYGLPGYERFPAVSVVVALLFVFHVAQNHTLKARLDAEERNEEAEAIREEARRLRETRAPEEDF